MLIQCRVSTTASLLQRARRQRNFLEETERSRKDPYHSFLLCACTSFAFVFCLKEFIQIFLSAAAISFLKNTSISFSFDLFLIWSLVDSVLKEASIFWNFTSLNSHVLAWQHRLLCYFSEWKGTKYLSQQPPVSDVSSKLLDFFFFFLIMGFFHSILHRLEGRAFIKCICRIDVGSS